MIELEPDLELTKRQAEDLLRLWLTGPVVCAEIRRLDGGLVNTVLLLEFDRSPYRAVVKLHRSQGDRLAGEARALEYLKAETSCPVPEVYLHDSSTKTLPYAFLLLEHIEGVRLSSLDLEPEERAEIDRQLASVLAELHGHHGTTWGDFQVPQTREPWEDSFATRLANVRSDPAVARRITAEHLARVDRAIDHARRALGDPGLPTLVHGDVWDGNVMVRQEGGRWQLAGLLDPDLQFADVEYELAYLEVFDEGQEAFFDAYAEHHALRPGYEKRRLFYWLYTALIHVALFGDERYRAYTAETADKIVAAYTIP